MIVNRYTGGVGYGFELESRNLAQDEVCALLNTIDLIGFLDYDPTAYYQQNLQFPRLQGSNYMLVSAWKTNAVDPGEITDFLEGGWLTGEVELDPPLLLTYELLRELSLQPLEPYAPERIVASIQKISQDAYEQIPGQDQGEWPLANISLETLFELAIPLETTWLRNVIVEDAEEVSSLINLFGIESAPAPRIYTENGQRYDIAIRALLPYETLASVGYAGKKDVIPGPDLTPATTPLTCTPEDGVVDLYYSLVAGD